jgi:flavin reductase (DIM6/NTAB) family NADH-FMN oxidoreductase RutF
MTDTTASAQLDSGLFRYVLGHYPTGVTVVTMIKDGQPLGMVVGSFTSVSLDPPLVAFLPDKSSSTYRSMGRPDTFVINVLGADQEPLCRTFASKTTTEKWAGVLWHPAASGAPILDAAVAWIDCRLHAVYDGGDHDIVVGRVEALDVNSPSLPLLFFQGGYGRFTPLSLVAPVEADLLQQLRLADLARSEMERIADDLSLECIAQVPVAGELVHIASAGPTPSSIVSRVGTRLPWVPPYGALHVAWAPDETFETWMQAATSPPTTQDRARYAEALDRVRRRGWSLALTTPVHPEVERTMATLSNGGHEDAATGLLLRRLMEQVGEHYEPADLRPGRSYRVRSIGAPVFGPDGTAEMGLKLFGLPDVLAYEEIKRLSERLVAGADAMTRASGGRRPD